MVVVVGGSCQCYGGMIRSGKKLYLALSKTAHPFWMEHPKHYCQVSGSLNIKIGFTIIAMEKINARGNNGR